MLASRGIHRESQPVVPPPRRSSGPPIRRTSCDGEALVASDRLVDPVRECCSQHGGNDSPLPIPVGHQQPRRRHHERPVGPDSTPHASAANTYRPRSLGDLPAESISPFIAWLVAIAITTATLGRVRSPRTTITAALSSNVGGRMHKNVPRPRRHQNSYRPGRSPRSTSCAAARPPSRRGRRTTLGRFVRHEQPSRLLSAATSAGGYIRTCPALGVIRTVTHNNQPVGGNMWEPRRTVGGHGSGPCRPRAEFSWGGSVGLSKAAPPSLLVKTP